MLTIMFCIRSLLKLNLICGETNYDVQLQYTIHSEKKLFNYFSNLILTVILFLSPSTIISMHLCKSMWTEKSGARGINTFSQCEPTYKTVSCRIPCLFCLIDFQNKSEKFTAKTFIFIVYNQNQKRLSPVNTTV